MHSDSSDLARRIRSDLTGMLIVTICSSLTLLSLTLAKSMPLGLYEPDLYIAVPVAVWIASFMSLALPVAVFALAILKGFESPALTRWLAIGYVVGNAGFLCIPWVRYPGGYDRWDSWYHLAETNAVVSGGRLSVSNFYPGTHILLAMLSEVTGTPLTGVFAAFPVFLNSLLLLITYLACSWLKVQFRAKFVGLIAVSAIQGLPLVLPLYFSGLFLLLLLALHLRQEKRLEYSLLSLALFSVLVLIHPLTALSVIVGLLVIGLFFRKRLVRPGTTALYGVIVASWIFWMTRSYVSPVRLIAQVVATGTFRGPEYAEVLAGVGLTGLAALATVAKILTARLALISFSAPAGKVALRDLFHMRPSAESRLGAWTIANIVVFLGFVSFFGAGTLGDILDRFVIYGLYAVVLLASLSLGRNVWSRRRTAGVVLVLGIVLVAGQVAFFYPAPVTARYNWETGTTDVIGLAWIGAKGVRGSTFNGSTYNHAILSGLIGSENATSLGFQFGMEFPKHLGCPPGPASTGRFTIVTSFDLFVFQRRGEFRPADLVCMREVQLYSQVYDNGGMWILERPDV